ncbi:MAG: methyltransferase domain-containing protein [candidate division NC10 bacterium]|nr:methyltransferase domain-containing protein [candidate division NC10 bacterium]
MSEPLKPSAPPFQRILETASAFQASRVLLTAVELDLFTLLDVAPRASAEAAPVINADPRGLDRLMNALAALGFLVKREGRFANAPEASRFLVRGKPGYIASLMHWVHLWETWGTLTAAVRRGGPVDRAAVGERGEAWLEAFIAAMHWRGTQHAPGVVGSLDLTGVARVLDVGGGSGAYAMAFVRAKAGLRATVFDLPGVLPLTRRYVAEANLTGAIEFAAGDYGTDPFGPGFDLVFLSAIVHSNSPDENRHLLRRCAAALAPGGQMVIQDFLIDEARSGPVFPALFALNMLVGTLAGDTYTETEIRTWMAEASIEAISRRDTPFGTSLLVGRRGRSA